MKIAPYVDKLHNSNEFKDFRTKNPDAILVAGFFVLDLQMKHNIHQIDYYVPSQKKVAAFTLDEKIIVQMMDLMGEKTPEELDMNTNIDLDALEGILMDEMKNRGYTEKVNKIIAVIQRVDGKIIWSISAVLSGMELLKAHIEDKSKSILKMEKVNMMDLIQMIPKEKLQQMQISAKDGAGKAVNGKSGNEEKIKKLDELEKKIDEEKERLRKAEEKAK